MISSCVLHFWVGPKNVHNIRDIAILTIVLKATSDESFLKAGAREQGPGARDPRIEAFLLLRIRIWQVRSREEVEAVDKSLLTSLSLLFPSPA
jgi:hypothetical protein